MRLWSLQRVLLSRSSGEKENGAGSLFAVELVLIDRPGRGWMLLLRPRGEQRIGDDTGEIDGESDGNGGDANGDGACSAVHSLAARLRLRASLQLDIATSFNCLGPTPSIAVLGLLTLRANTLGTCCVHHTYIHSVASILLLT